MLKKMKLRFILAAMTAFGAVMIVLVLGINIITYSVTAGRQDKVLAGIMEYEQMKMSLPVADMPMISEMPWANGPEADFTTRFFCVHCDELGIIESISREHISSIDRATAQFYLEKVMSKDQKNGYVEEYRYMIQKNADGFTVGFLNVSNEQRFVHSLFWTSVIIALVSLLVVLVLIILISNKAIRPYAKNMERQKRFITDAGHELKTPLTSIATSADILAMEDEDNEWIKNIQKQTARLTRLVSDLVALSRLDEEMPFPEKAEFSISDAAWETAEHFASLAQAEGKKYSQHIEEELKMEGDRSAIQQMMSILLDNAVRYSDKGGEIHLDIYHKHNKIYVEVSNTCELPGDSELNRLFDRFYRLDESRSSNTGGTGIGLSLAKAIVENHGGKITATSKDGKTILFRAIFS